MLNILKLEETAKENGKSFSFLSEKVLGKYRTYLKDVKFGKAKLSLEYQQILADELGVSIEWLNDETDIKEKAVTVSDDSLTPEEEDVISIYRSLSPEQKEAFHTLFSKK